VTASDHALELATVAARAAAGKLAGDVVAIDVSDHLVITDIFVLASAPNDRQVKAIVEAVEIALNTVGVKPIRREGERDGRWVLLDFGELVVHVQHAEERSYYSLERLWRDCPAVDLPDDVRASNEAAAERSGERSDDAYDSFAGSGQDAGSAVSGVPGATGA
jgi:ribosome-associated protein